MTPALNLKLNLGFELRVGQVEADIGVEFDLSYVEHEVCQVNLAVGCSFQVKMKKKLK